MTLDKEQKTPTQKLLENLVELVAKELKKDDEQQPLIEECEHIPNLADEPIDEVIDTLYQNGIEYYLTNGTAEQKEVLSRAIAQIMTNDSDLLLQMFLEITEASKLVYECDCRFSEPQPEKMAELKKNIIDLFEVTETFKGAE